MTFLSASNPNYQPTLYSSSFSLIKKIFYTAQKVQEKKPKDFPRYSPLCRLGGTHTAPSSHVLCFGALREVTPRGAWGVEIWEKRVGVREVQRGGY